MPCKVNLLGLPPVSLWIRGERRESGGRGGRGVVILFVCGNWLWDDVGCELGGWGKYATIRWLFYKA